MINDAWTDFTLGLTFYLLSYSFRATNFYSQCAPACFTCELIDFDTRCPFDRNAPKAWEKPGDLERFFERLLEQTADHPEYKPTVYSGPALYTATPENGTHTAPPAAVVNGPWVVTLENVLSGDECERLIELGHVEGFEPSKEVGAKMFDGSFDSFLNTRRTSTNTWCKDACYDDPLVQQLTARIERLMGIPSNHSEYWQLLRYEETQEYSTSPPG